MIGVRRPEARDGSYVLPTDAAGCECGNGAFAALGETLAAGSYGGSRRVVPDGSAVARPARPDFEEVEEFEFPFVPTEVAVRSGVAEAPADPRVHPLVPLVGDPA